MIREDDVLLVARRWKLRGRHTSVERFLDYVPDAARITGDDLWQRPDRLLHLVAASARHHGYTIWGVELEIRAVTHTLRHRPRVVHFLYGDHDFHFSGRALRALGARTVATFYFSVDELQRRMPRKGHLDHLDLVVATGREQFDHLGRFVPPERLALVPLGVDTGFFAPAPDGDRSPLRLLQVGANRRDLPTLAAAFEDLRAELPGVTLHLVGCPAAESVFGGVTPGCWYCPCSRAGPATPSTRPWPPGCRWWRRIFPTWSTTPTRRACGSARPATPRRWPRPAGGC